MVPMTKSEIRAVCLSKLQLPEDAVCWDIGAGTGSVSIEMALQAWRGQVYAVECREDALELLRENRHRFGAENLKIVPGTAPEPVAVSLLLPTLLLAAVPVISVRLSTSCEKRIPRCVLLLQL